MDFVNFNLAKKLKEKGFIELCLAYYTNDNTLYYNYSHKAGASYTDCYRSHHLMPKDSVSGKFVDVPTISQVLKWLREKHNLYVCPQFLTFGEKEIYHLWDFSIINLKNNGLLSSEGELHLCDSYKNYEQATLAGIEYVLDNLI